MDNSLNNYSPAELAARCINQTNKPVFLTGKAGTGKTTFLRNIIEHTHKNAIIVAPTGIAAINANGVTIHSQFGVPFGLFIPDSSFKIDNYQVKVNTPYTMVKHLNMREQKRKLLQELELLIIDEVSMLRADLLDTIDFVLKNVRRQTHKPFGGVQVLFIGDLMQLPPIVKDEEWHILKNYYNSIYFFDALVLKNEKPVYIELDKIYRQSDSTFIDLLNNLRNNTVTQENINLLNSYYQPNFDEKTALNTITLTTHNNIADSKNKTALETLTGKSFFYYATINGEFAESAYPLPSILELKVGAQIMFVKNDITGKQQYFNGKIGVVSSLKDKEIEIDFKDGSKPFVLENYQWKNIKYELNAVTNEIEENEIGEFIHYPIKLAWAITVHKSQGLTFEKAILDINRAFAPGQVYVALSRLKSLDGLVLTSPIQFTAISQDRVLVNYSANSPKKEEVNTVIEQETNTFLKSIVFNAYDFNWLYSNIKIHADSYVMAENKSTKQKYDVWAKGLLEKVEPLKLNADKFQNQLIQLFESNSVDYLNLVDERNKAAKNYFYPQLKELSKSILLHIEAIKEEKQIKTYLTELLDLENLLFKQMQLMDKATLVLDTILHKKEFNKQEFKQNTNQQDRLELVRQSIQISEKANFEEKPKKERKKKAVKSGQETVKKEKTIKPDTKETSFDLYKTGKTIFEIATERGLGITTIEGHLAHYVSLGMIPVSQFVANEKYQTIIESSKKYTENPLSSVKLELGEDYTYSEIRFALATQTHLKKE